MKLAQLRAWYKDAVKYKDCHRFAAMVVELCNEVVRLQSLADEKHGELSDFSLMTFGEHKGRKLADVPEDYLRWWLSQNSDRSIIQLEVRFKSYPEKAIAVHNLRLHDYLVRRFNGG